MRFNVVFSFVVVAVKVHVMMALRRLSTKSSSKTMNISQIIKAAKVKKNSLDVICFGKQDNCLRYSWCRNYCLSLSGNVSSEYE